MAVVTCWIRGNIQFLSLGGSKTQLWIYDANVLEVTRDLVLFLQSTRDWARLVMPGSGRTARGFVGWRPNIGRTRGIVQGTTVFKFLGAGRICALVVIEYVVPLKCRSSVGLLSSTTKHLLSGRQMPTLILEEPIEILLAICRMRGGEYER